MQKPLKNSSNSSTIKIVYRVKNKRNCCHVKKSFAAHQTRGFTISLKDIGVYLLMGLPGQPLEEVVESIRFVHAQGVQVKPAEFTPIPAPSNGNER